MIIIPSFTISDLSTPALTLDLLAEWAWYGFTRLEISLARPPVVHTDRRSLELICRECPVPVRFDADVADLDEIAGFLDAGAGDFFASATRD